MPMPDFKEPFVWGCCAALILLIVFLVLTEESFQTMPFLHKLADELIIAVLLALFVDSYVKERLKKDIVRDVWPYASAHGLPEPVKKHLEQLLRMSFIREDLTLRVKLDPVDGFPGFFRATLAASFRIRNLSEVEHQHPFKSKIEKSHYPHVGESRIEYVNVQGDSAFPLEGAALQAKVIPRPSYFEFPFKIAVPPASRGPIEIRTQRSRVYQEIDTHTLDILEATVGITVVAEGPENLDWDVQFGASVKPDQKPQGREWYDSGLHLPGQVISVRWWPKPVTAGEKS